MAGSTIGTSLRITTFGESHGPAVGVVIDGVRPGVPLTVDMVRGELARRRPGTSDLVSPRREPDEPEILSGVFDGLTTGSPICILVRNRDADPSEYQAVADLFRPGHGDHSWLARFGIRDWRGGGRQSGRETVGRVAAGAVARTLLGAQGITVRAHVVNVDGIAAPRCLSADFPWDAVAASPVFCADPVASDLMARAIRSASESGDSLGGIVEIVAEGVPAGLGDPVFHKLDAELAAGLMSIGAVKGVEIGDGFAVARMRGRDAVDEMDSGGYRSNHAGGILGGISNGMPVVARIAVKPTPGIAGTLHTIDTDGNEIEYVRKGRSDPCICVRMVPVAEAMFAIVLADALMSFQNLQKSAIADK